MKTIRYTVDQNGVVVVLTTNTTRGQHTAAVVRAQAR
jgi:hypothetical protein